MKKWKKIYYKDFEWCIINVESWTMTTKFPYNVRESVFLWWAEEEEIKFQNCTQNIKIICKNVYLIWVK